MPSTSSPAVTPFPAAVPEESQWKHIVTLAPNPGIGAQTQPAYMKIRRLCPLSSHQTSTRRSTRSAFFPDLGSPRATSCSCRSTCRGAIAGAENAVMGLSAGARDTMGAAHQQERAHTTLSAVSSSVSEDRSAFVAPVFVLLERGVPLGFAGAESAAAPPSELSPAAPSSPLSAAGDSAGLSISSNSQAACNSAARSALVPGGGVTPRNRSSCSSQFFAGVGGMAQKGSLVSNSASASWTLSAAKPPPPP